MMTGVIWVVQLVHYPTYLWIDESRFAAFEAFHCNRIGFIVAPLMILEATTGLYLTWAFPGVTTVTGLILIGIVWASTFFIQVPIHNRLSSGFDRTLALQLIHTNWIRTALWTIRLVLGILVIRP
jgi:hypothetical protein